MDFEVLRAFVAVAEEGKFTQAAERLHRSPSPVTRAVQQLERQVGVPLLVRSSSGVRTTAAGELVLRLSRSVLELEGELLRVGRVVGASPVRVVAGLCAAVSWGLADAVVGVLMAQFGSSLSVASSSWSSAGSSASVTEAVARGEVDLGVVYLPELHDQVQTVALVEHAWTVIVPGEDALAQAPTVAVEDLAGRRVALAATAAHPRLLAQARTVLTEAGALTQDLPDTDPHREPLHAKLGHTLLLTRTIPTPTHHDPTPLTDDLLARPLTGTHLRATLALAHHRDHHHPWLPHLTDTLRDTLTTRIPPPWK